MSAADDLWPLFRAVAADGESAWQPLAEALHPVLLAMAARQPIGRLRASEDSQHEIVVSVLERLYARDLAGVRRVCAVDPPPNLEAWLRVIVRRSAIDYMRESPEYERARTGRDDRWVSLVTLASTAPAGDDSLAVKRDAVLGFVRAAVARGDREFREHGEDAFGRLALEWSIPRIHVRRLVQRGARYLATLDAILAGHSYLEIATQQGVTRREVELTVHYLEELLAARRFGSTP